MNVKNTVITENDISTISGMELQQSLAKTPECVLVFGSYHTLSDRMGEMGISMNRNGGTCYFGKGCFTETFNFCEYTSKGHKFLRFGKGECGEFYLNLDENEMITLMDSRLEKSISSSKAVNAKDLHSNVRDGLRSKLSGETESTIAFKVEKDGMVPNRATKFAFGTIMEVLSSNKFFDMGSTCSVSVCV